MGADAFHVFYGLRWEVDANAEEEMSLLESRDDPRQGAARKHGLDCWWGATMDENVYYILVGRLVGHFGWQHDADGLIEPSDLAELMEETQRKLRTAGFVEAPAWRFQFEPNR